MFSGADPQRTPLLTFSRRAAAEMERRAGQVLRRGSGTYLIFSTIHSAKGQEWRSVHVLNVVGGCIPSDLGTGSAGMTPTPVIDIAARARLRWQQPG